MVIAPTHCGGGVGDGCGRGGAVEGGAEGAVAGGGVLKKLELQGWGGDVSSFHSR